MKIAFVSSHISNSLQFVWFQQELKRQNIEHIHIIIDNSNEPLLLARALNENKLPVYELKFKNTSSFVTLFFEVRKILKQEKINVVHTTLPYGNLIGQLAALSLGIKARVTTCENASWAFDYHSKKQWLIDKFTFMSAKKVISVANTANDFLLNKWHLNPKKLIQINHALAFDQYDNVPKERLQKIEELLNVGKDDFVIGMIARTEFWKGHQYAVEAMKTVSEKHPEIKLLICGSVGFDHQRLLDLIALNRLEKNVRFVGFVPDPIAFLKFIKIQVHIPINKYVENCGISIIEGMAARTPQLLSLSGYAYQSAQHLKNAYVVDYCNSKEVAEGILYLYSNYEKAREFGEQAYRDALNDYTIEVKFNRHMKVYTELLAQKNN